MSDLPEVIAIRAPAYANLAPPGRREPLHHQGEIVRLDGFWRWAQEQGMVTIVHDPVKVEAFKRQTMQAAASNDAELQARRQREQELESVNVELTERLRRERETAAARESELQDEIERARKAAAEAEKAKVDAENKLREAAKPSVEANSERTQSSSSSVEEPKKSKK
jgi:hypothetical protein